MAGKKGRTGIHGRHHRGLRDLTIVRIDSINTLLRDYNPKQVAHMMGLSLSVVYARQEILKRRKPFKQEQIDEMVGEMVFGAKTADGISCYID